uniref:Integrase catalytic domain-containing protein n=1 Tax=Glossina morsitans morsitans TaxID=37546 RepID=A0A1B0ES26_GLOMM
MLLVFMNNVSKWVHLVSLRRTIPEGLMKAFRERIFRKLGVSKELVTEKGGSYNIVRPYTTRENPKERINGTLKTNIAQYYNKEHATWDKYLPEITLAKNTAVSKCTGYSPTYIIHRR